MIPFSSAISNGPTWSKIPHSRSYELKLNEEVVGTLRRTSFWSSNFLAETVDGRWTFHRGGFLSTGAEIVDAASEQRIATFKSAWPGGGILTFADGQMFHLECKGWRRPVWSVIADGGQTVLRVHTREKTVEFTTGARVPDSRMPLLAMFAWSRVLQAEEDAASAAAAIAS